MWPAVASTAAATIERADAVREMDGDRAVPVIRHDAAEHQREVGNRQPGAAVAHGGADDDLRVNERRRSSRDGAQHPVVDARRPTAIQPRDVKSAIATVRQKKISARPACAVETASGRK